MSRRTARDARGLGLIGLLLALASCRNSTAADVGLVPVFGRAPRAAGPDPVVSGTALEARSGKPVAGATIRGPGGVETTSDASGRFVLRGLPAGASGELVGTTASGLSGKNRLQPLQGGVLEVVLYLR